LPALVTKTMGNFVNPVLVEYITYMVAFDLWMSRGDKYDTFVHVVSFINALWQTWTWQLGLFIVESMGMAMAKQMKDLLGSFGLLNKVITFVRQKN
jgi:hypothetical protein